MNDFDHFQILSDTFTGMIKISKRATQLTNSVTISRVILDSRVIVSNKADAAYTT